MTTTGSRLTHDGHVLVGVKAKPSGWPTASPDSDSGRDPEATTRNPGRSAPQNHVFTLSGDCQIPKPWGTFVMTMNAALKPFSVHVRYPGADALLDTPSTYEVAVLQLAQLIAEDRQVRPCANERCTRLFTRQRGRAKYDKTCHSTGVLYCSAQCAEAQSERNRRARLRAEGPAGRPPQEG